jgi:hypothetical protein
MTNDKEIRQKRREELRMYPSLFGLAMKEQQQHWLSYIGRAS